MTKKDSTNKYLTDYYNQDLEDSRLNSQSGSVEFLTTMHYVDKYLKAGDKIVDIGAGTGKYSFTLNSKGHAVDAVELIAHNINKFTQNIKTLKPHNNLTVSQGNATDLSDFGDNIYDITLLLGPMYHLFTMQDKLKAIGEALRVTKKGGIVFVAYCISDRSILVSGFKRKLFGVKEFIDNGFINPQDFSTKSDPSKIFELVRKENIDLLMTDFKVKRLHYLAADGYASHAQAEIDAMDKDEFALFLQYHYATCERYDMLGYTAHALDIFKKLL